MALNVTFYPVVGDGFYSAATLHLAVLCNEAGLFLRKRSDLPFPAALPADFGTRD